MRKPFALTACCLLLSGLVSLGPQAGATTFLNCSISGTISISNNAVVSGRSCSGTVAVPDSVTEIEGGVFGSNTSLTGVTFGPASNLRTIGDSAFNFATALTSITIPASVTSIGFRAFSRALSLREVNFAPGSRLETLGNSAFQSALSLRKISIPDGVQILRTGTFTTTSQLREVTFGADSRLNLISDNVFDKATVLESVTLPSTLESLGNNVFSGASLLNKVTFLGDAPTVGTNVFLGVAVGAKALISRQHVGSGAGQFGPVGSSWNGLQVQVLTSKLTLNSESSASEQEVEFGGSPLHPKTVRSGFSLLGWSLTPNGNPTFASDLANFKMGASDSGLFAVWEPAAVAPNSDTGEVQVVQFSGPLLRSFDRRNFDANSPATISFRGKRLNQISSAAIDGVALRLQSRSPGNIVLAIPSLAPGLHTIVLESKSGRLTLARFLIVN